MLSSLYLLLLGSILAVTVADMYAKGKSSRFVGICTRRGGYGLGATFVLRNVVNDLGEDVENVYFMKRTETSSSFISILNKFL